MTTAAATVFSLTRSLLSRHLPIPISIKPPNNLCPPPQFSPTITHNRTMACSTAHVTDKSSNGGKFTAPYGSWKSPITADVVSGAEKRLGGFAVAGDGRVLWIETRPHEKGRAVLVKEPVKLGDEPLDVIPQEFAARTLAQEYGGGAFAVLENMIIFSNYKDQRLYKQLIEGCSPVPLTPDYGEHVVCYADGVFDPCFNRYLTVMEDHRESSLNPTTAIVSIELSDGHIHEPKKVVAGNDFYAFPRIDPLGTRMAWIEWSHPHMHWDKAQLWVGYFSENGDLFKRVCVAGGDNTPVESPSEPKWSMKGDLYFVSDRESGFWNIYKWIEDKNEVAAVYPLNAEFTKPFWVFGISSYDFVRKDGDNHKIVCSYRLSRKIIQSSFSIPVTTESSSCKLQLMCLTVCFGIYHYAGRTEGHTWEYWTIFEALFLLLETPFTDISNIISAPNCFYIEGASATHPLSIAQVTLDDSLTKAIGFSIVWSSSSDITKYRAYFSLPELIKFPTEVPGQNAYAYFYPPSNPYYQATSDEKPPLLVKSHGGPTAETRGILDLNIQYWTSRGWAFVDVNYGGSTGYGREYRERLLGKWGIVDVNDCCSCATFLAESGKVDGQRLCITGRSAGGYTTLACLAFRDTFKAGASLYGVADLSLLRVETHKFESHYMDNLVGDESAFFERSPINHVDKFTCPVILFQGLDDKVVPPDQARKIYMALKEKGLPVALVEFEGEQHGFRKAENIKFALEQQMMFFARLVGKFQVADDISPIKIDNLD